VWIPYRRTAGYIEGQRVEICRFGELFKCKLSYNQLLYVRDQGAWGPNILPNEAVATSWVLAGALVPCRHLPRLSRSGRIALPLPSASRYYQAISLLRRLPSNWCLLRARRGCNIRGDSTWTLWQYSHCHDQCRGQTRAAKAEKAEKAKRIERAPRALLRPPA
jgi:hypothetical protein